MKLPSLVLAAGMLLAAAAQAQQVLETGSQKPMPKEWIDKDTGHRVVRLTGKTGPIGNWYFHNNPFFNEKAGEGDKMLFSDSDAGVRQVFTLNLKTMAVEQLTSDATNKRLYAMTLPRTREAIYQSGDSVYAVNVDTKATRLLVKFPEGVRGGISTVNADGTKFAGNISSPEQMQILRQYPAKSDYFDRIYDAHLPNKLFTIDIKTGEFKIIHEENNWLGHIQFSPTDPNILMYCQEGPWHKVDRVWHFNLATGTNTLMHKRTMPMEIAGHEFFQPDGKAIWFDLQKPRGQKFYLAGADVATGKPIAQYEMTPDLWSIHFTMSPDQRFFAGDGGDPTQVAKAKDGMWIYALYPEGERLRGERLVNMKAHDYRGLEPNVHFSPDGKWVIFGGTFEGERHTYAVEIAKARP